MTTPFRQLEIRRGNKADLPLLLDGELGFCEDTGELFVGSLSGNVKVNMAYVAAVPGNWAGSPPATLAIAIDRLVAEVAILKGGPV